MKIFPASRSSVRSCFRAPSANRAGAARGCPSRGIARPAAALRAGAPDPALAARGR